MADFLNEMYSWIAFLPKITLRNVLEIIIITFLVYQVLIWIKNTRAWTLLKGIVVILGFVLFAAVLELDNILWILGKVSAIAITALIIIFQPELRKALEELGSKKLFIGLFSFDDQRGEEEFGEKTMNEIARATFELAKVKTGALMVIERAMPLHEIERTGIAIDGVVTSQLLINIFEHNTPLHDGAIVIRGNRITAATCYLPLSDSMAISKDLGTRHRAALGISETSDSLTVVVSEETGHVTVALGGQLRRISDADELKKALSVVRQEDISASRFKIWKGRRKNERKAD